MNLICLFKYKNIDILKIQESSKILSFTERITSLSGRATIHNSGKSIKLQDYIKNVQDLEYIKICIDTEDNIIRTYLQKDVLDIFYNFVIGGQLGTTLEETIEIDLNSFQEE